MDTVFGEGLQMIIIMKEMFVWHQLYLKASISEMMQSCTLQSNQISAVAGKTDDSLVCQIHTVGQAEIP